MTRAAPKRTHPQWTAWRHCVAAFLLLGIAAAAAPADAGGVRTGIAILPPQPVYGPSPGYVPSPSTLPPGVAPLPVPPVPPQVTYWTPPQPVPVIIPPDHGNRPALHRQ